MGFKDFLPKWPVLSRIPSDLTLSVTHLAVPSGGEEVFFVVDGNMPDSELYRVALKTGDCTRFDQLKGAKIKQIVVDYGVVLIITEDKLYSLGNNFYGQIGNGQQMEAIIEEPFLVLQESVAEAAIGLSHCTCLTTEGDIYTWGSGLRGQLGYPGDNFQPRKLIVDSSQPDQKFSQICCCRYVTFALDRSGRLFCWGESQPLNLVPRSIETDAQAEPTEIKFPENVRVKQICCCWSVYAVTEQGSLYAWGENRHGELGFGHCSDVVKPTRLVAFDEKGAGIESILIAGQTTIAKSKKGIFVWGYKKINISNGKYYDKDLKVVETPRPIRYTYLEPKLKPAGKTILSIYLKEAGGTPGLISIDDLRPPLDPTLAVFAKSFDDEATSDFKVIVEGQKIHVHKAILKIRSAHFRLMFSGDTWKENRADEMPIEHTPYSVYRAFLYYLYSGQVADSLTIEECYMLMDLAKCYLDDQLASCIGDLVLEHCASLETVLACYASARQQQSDHISDRCLDFIMANLTQLVKSESFKSLNPECAKELLAAAAQRNLLKQ